MRALLGDSTITRLKPDADLVLLFATSATSSFLLELRYRRANYCPLESEPRSEGLGPELIFFRLSPAALAVAGAGGEPVTIVFSAVKPGCPQGNRR